MNVFDRYKVVTVCRMGEQNGLMVSDWEVQAVGGVGPTDAQLAAHFSTLFATPILNCMTSNAQYRGVRIQYYSPGLVRDWVQDTTGQADGNRDVEALPTNTAGLISLKTGLAGPRNRGRKYIPFPAEEDNDAGAVPSAAYKAAAATLGAIFIGTLNTTNGANTSSLRSGHLNLLTSTFNLWNFASIAADWAHIDRRAQEARGDTQII